MPKSFSPSLPSRIMASALLFALMMQCPVPLLAEAVDADTVRAIGNAIAGRVSLSAETASALETAISTAMADPEAEHLAREYMSARQAYMADRKKFPAERSAEVKQRYVRARDQVVNRIKQGLAIEAPDLLTRLENEGESAMDSAARNRLAVQPIADVPGLPRVLLIGDSISIGYTLQVRALLEGKANVHRIPGNGGATEVGLANMAAWLGDGKWDVIHFNFGLHDAKYMSETTQRSSRSQYADNLQRLVDQMKATGAELIFATTTPVPNDGNLSPTRRFDSIPERNEVAVTVMRENGVAINDLHRAVLPVQATVGRTNDVHFQEKGYELLAKQVAAAVEARLPQSGNRSDTSHVRTLLDTRFSSARYGTIPDGWHDMINKRPSRNWAVDGNGVLRPVLKFDTGLLVFNGISAGHEPMPDLASARLEAEFTKTEEDAVFFGIAARVQDPDNYYLARFSGANRLELLKVQDGHAEPMDSIQPNEGFGVRPTGTVTLRRYREGQMWRMIFSQEDDRFSVSILDDEGREMARLDAKDGEFQTGLPGLCVTTFAGATSFAIAASPQPPMTVHSQAHQDEPQNDPSFLVEYSVVKPEWRHDLLNTPADQLSQEYDVIVAGAGTGGIGAALQAARMGARVLLLEETDWIGGQMCAAAVTTMDESSVYGKFPVRERGIYREFHESMVLYYQTLLKDPFVTYFGWPYQHDAGYEPKAARAVLYGLIKETREREATLDLSVQSRVVAVRKAGDAVIGITVEIVDEVGTERHDIGCAVLVDATEYGDVIPLTGARYRVGNATSDRPDPSALVQDHTWTAVLREYPGGVPEHLQIKDPPPGYESGSGKRYRNYTKDGFLIWGAAGKGIKVRRSWRVYFAWRGMVDADSPLTGLSSNLRHTQCGFNGGNDYPVTAATIDDVAQRLLDEREGIYKTLGALYYFQQELGVNWSLAADEGFATSYNRARMSTLNLRPDLESLAVHLPQMPYVRESRRIIGIETLVADDLKRYEAAILFPSSVAMGDYFMDLDHGKTAHAVEPDLDSEAPPRGSGPFQVPFEVFIPERIDGFLPAEKNFSQSRLANGATRLQPITMLTGQAVGAIAALAARQGVQPRQVKVIEVQSELLDSGSTLIQRWYGDLPWGTGLWKATQLLSLYQVMDRPGPITKDDQPLGAEFLWGASEPLGGLELRTALKKLRELDGATPALVNVPAEDTVSVTELQNALNGIDPDWAEALSRFSFENESRVSRGEFALVASRILLQIKSS